MSFPFQFDYTNSTHHLSVFSQECLRKITEDCDDRIGKLQASLDKVRGFGLNDIEDIHENGIKLVKTEKIVWNAFGNPQSNKDIFKILLAKYDELLNLSYEQLNDKVVDGTMREGIYLDGLKKTLEHRKLVKTVCSVGYKNEL